MYESVEMGASSSHGSLYGLSARARAGGAGRCLHTQTLEFNERGARPAPQPDHVCTMPRARGKPNHTSTECAQCYVNIIM